MDRHHAAFDALEKIGVHLDDINYSLRLLDPDVAGLTNELKNELHHFIESKSDCGNQTLAYSSLGLWLKLGRMTTLDGVGLYTLSDKEEVGLSLL